MDPAAWGIEPGYHDIHGTWQETSSRTAAELLRAMGAERDDPPPAAELWVVRASEGLHVGGRWEPHTEGRRYPACAAGTVTDPPLGYHTLFSEHDGRKVDLIVSPGACHPRSGPRSWGWAAQLYALRSSASWGIGDLGDLRRAAAWAKDLGAGLLLVNPLHAPVTIAPIEPSPYYPSSRCFRSPLYLRVEDVPGVSGLGDEVVRAASAGRALLQDLTIRPACCLGHREVPRAGGRLDVQRLWARAAL